MQSGPFSKQYRLRTLDLRGHGASRESPRRFTIEAFAADVADALRRDGEPPAHVIGLSLGGCVGLALALAAPDRVRSLTLVNAFAQLRPAGIRGAMKISQRLALLCTAPMPTVARHVARGLFPRPDQREQYLAAVARLGSNPRWTYLAGSLWRDSTSAHGLPTCGVPRWSSSAIETGRCLARPAPCWSVKSLRPGSRSFPTPGTQRRTISPRSSIGSCWTS